MTVRPSSEDGRRSLRRAVAGLRRASENCQGQLGWSAAILAVAEFLGTALMVFFICTAGAVDIAGDGPSYFRNAVASGCTISVVIQIFGHISAAHFNPAVTLAAVIIGKVNIPLAFVYTLAECGGAVLGYGFMQLVLPLPGQNNAAPGGACCATCVTAPHHSLSPLQALTLECVATAFLVLLACSCWDARNRDKQDSNPLKFAFLITAVSSIIGPMTGASLNPARTLGPAVWTNHWEYHWVYWAGPLLGAVVAASSYRLVFVELARCSGGRVDVTGCDGKAAELQHEDTAAA